MMRRVDRMRAATLGVLNFTHDWKFDFVMLTS